jgi:membrane protein DedA with SNARE-associated domain
MSFLSSLGLDLPELIREYGYLFVFVGTMLEGETVLVLGMIAAHQGLLDAWVVGAVAMVGTYIGDLGYYLIGVRFGRAFLDRFPRVDAKVQRIKGWIVRHDIAIIIVNRFLYGFRIAAPVALGMSAVPAWRFMVFNVVGAAVWTVVIGGAGYLFGSALETLLDDVRWHDQIIIGLVLLLGIGLWIGRYIARRLMRGG